MSADATGYVWRHSPHDDSTMKVHLALADSANDLNDNLVWHTTRDLAAKARVDQSTAARALARLVKEGFLEIVQAPRPGPGGSGVYRFLFADKPVKYDARKRKRNDAPRINGATPAGPPNDAPRINAEAPSIDAPRINRIDAPSPGIDAATPGAIQNQPKEQTQDARTREAKPNPRAPLARPDAGARMPVTWRPGRGPDLERQRLLEALAADDPPPIRSCASSAFPLADWRKALEKAAPSGSAEVEK